MKLETFFRGKEQPPDRRPDRFIRNKHGSCSRIKMGGMCMLEGSCKFQKYEDGQENLPPLCSRHTYKAERI